MAKLTNQQKYISDLLYVNKTITERIFADIDEIQRGRGRSPEDVKASLIYVLDEAFGYIDLHNRQSGGN